MIVSPKLFQNSLRTGAVTSVVTTFVAAACGAMENGNAVAPLNAVSHIVWGNDAAAQDDVTWKFTATGVAVNTAAVVSWAAIHEMLFGHAADEGDAVGALLGGAVVSAIAYVVDYHVVPASLTPGFEKRLSNRSLLGIYVALAVALGLGSLMGDRQRMDERTTRVD